MEAGDQSSELAELAAKNAELEAKNAGLEAKIEKLIELLGQSSRNSHLPPSSDGPRKPKSKEGKRKRKRGGQKGDRGTHRQRLPPEHVDVFPEVCLDCGAALSQVVDEDARCHQVIDFDLARGGACQRVPPTRGELSSRSSHSGILQGGREAQVRRGTRVDRNPTTTSIAPA